MPKLVSTMVLVYCADEHIDSIKRTLRHEATIRNTWREIEALAPRAKCLVVVEERPGDKRAFLEEVRLLAHQVPTTGVIVVSGVDAATADALGEVPFRHKFVAIAHLETDLLRAVKAVLAETAHAHVMSLLLDFPATGVTRRAISTSFGSDQIPKSDSAHATAVGCKVKDLRKNCKADLGLTPLLLRRWSRLLWALELASGGVEREEIAAMLGVDSSTIFRDSEALVGMSFAGAGRAGIAVVASRLIGGVRKHQASRHA